MPKNNLAFIILANNSEKVITDCLESIKWAGEIIVIDNNRDGSKDKTVEISKSYQAKVIHYRKGILADFRTWVVKEAFSDWIFYLDADERVTKELKEELIKISAGKPREDEIGVYDVPRDNFFLGKKWHRGDWVTRFFFKPRLIKWQGKLHETPIFKGKLGKLKHPINHWTHTDLESMTLKTLRWSKIEGKLLYQANHPKMAGWRFLRMMLAEFYKRLIRQQYYKNGVEGWIEAIFQSFSVFMTYVRLWEYQTGKLDSKDRPEDHY